MTDNPFIRREGGEQRENPFEPRERPQREEYAIFRPEREADEWSWEQEPGDPTIAGHAGEFFRRIPGGAIGSVGATTEGVGVLAENIRRRLGGEHRDLEESAFVRGGRGMREYAEDRFGPRPGYEDSIAGEVGAATGSLGTYILAGGPVGGAARAGLARAGAGQLAQSAGRRGAQFGAAASMAGPAGAQEAYSRAMRFIEENPDSGLTEDDAIELSSRGVPAGLIQIASLGPILRHIPEPAKRRSAAYLARRMGEAGITEFTVENAGAFLQNQLQQEYDPDHPIWDQIPESGEPAAYAAALLQAATFPFLGRRGGGRGPSSGGSAEAVPAEETGLFEGEDISPQELADEVEAGIRAAAADAGMEAGENPFEARQAVTAPGTRVDARPAPESPRTAPQAAPEKASPLEGPETESAARRQAARFRAAADAVDDPVVAQTLRQDADRLEQEAEGLKPKMTPAERARRRRQLDPENDDLAMAIRKLGGLDTALETDWEGRLSQLDQHKPVGLPNLERPGRGRPLDDLAESLHEIGYLRRPDASELAEALGRVETGERVLALGNEAIEGERLLQEREEAAQAAIDGEAPAPMELATLEDLEQAAPTLPEYQDAAPGQLFEAEEYLPEMDQPAKTLAELTDIAGDRGVDENTIMQALESENDAAAAQILWNALGGQADGSEQNLATETDSPGAEVRPGPVLPDSQGAGGADVSPEPVTPQTPDAGRPRPASSDPAGDQQGVTTDRRRNIATRKAIADMTGWEKDMAIADLRHERMTSPIAGIPNGVAFQEDFDAMPPDNRWAVAADMDGLGWLNDNWGHEPTNGILRAVGQVLQEEADATGVRWYHLHGDEFAALASSEAEAGASADRVRERLANSEIVVEGILVDSGEAITETLQGIGLTTGTGADYGQADSEAKQEKTRREETGERTPKGSVPIGVRPGATGTAPGEAEGESGAEVVPAENQGELLDELSFDEEVRANLAGASPEQAPLIVLRDMIDAGTDIMNDQVDFPSGLAAEATQLSRRIEQALSGQADLAEVRREADAFLEGLLSDQSLDSGMGRSQFGVIHEVIQRQDRIDSGDSAESDLAGPVDETAQQQADAQKAVDDRRDGRGREEVPVEAGEGDLFSGRSRQTDLTDIAGRPPQTYGERRSDRKRRIREAETVGQVDAILQEEYSDSERHFEGTTEIEQAASARTDELTPRKPTQPEKDALRVNMEMREQGFEQVPKGSLAGRSMSAAMGEIPRLERENPGYEYRVEQTGPDGDTMWGVFRREVGEPGSPANPIVATRQKDIRDAAALVETDPTDAQVESGNYRKGHIRLHGLNIAIENPRGSIRRGRNGQRWQRKMKHDYGYIKRTDGADGDQVDVFLGGQATNSNAPVVVVDQFHQDGTFDEHKIMIGFASSAAARKAYLDAYPASHRKKPHRFTTMAFADFATWLSNGDQTRPAAEVIDNAETVRVDGTPVPEGRAEQEGRPGEGRPDIQRESEAGAEAGGREAGSPQEEVAAQGDGLRTRETELTDAEREVMAEADEIPVPIQLRAIPMGLATQAHAGTSHSPETRARQERIGYVRQMISDWRSLERYARNEAEREVLAQEFEQYAQRYAQHMRQALSARSRVMSPMITGPARFPTARNQKRGEAYEAKLSALETLQERAFKAIRRKVRPDLSPIQTGQDNALEMLEKKLASRQEAQEVMKAANKIIRSGKDVENRLIEAGVPTSRVPELLKPDFMGRVGFPDYALKNNNAEIRRIKKRIEQEKAHQERAEAAPEPQTVQFDGGEVAFDYAENRLRIRHDQKPDYETRQQLKRFGFRWSRKEGAWQRQITPQAIHRAQEIVGVDLISFARGIGEATAEYGKTRKEAGQVRDDGPQQMELWSEATVAEKKRGIEAIKRRVKSVQVGEFRWSGGEVRTAEDVASLMAPLRKDPQERFMALATDAEGRPLGIISDSRGRIDAATVNVEMVIGALAEIPGAKNAWFVHNHPSGRASQSGADKDITEKLAVAAQASSLAPRGMVVVAPTGEASHFIHDAGWPVSRDFLIEPRGRRGETIPVSERQFRRIGQPGPVMSEPSVAKERVREISGGENGVVFLDNRLRPIAFMPMTKTDMTALKGMDTTGPAAQIFRAVHETNAAAMFVVANGADAQMAAKNVWNFAKDTMTSTTVYDAFVDGESLAVRGEMGGGTWFSVAEQRGPGPGLAPEAAQRMVAELSGDWANAPPVRVVRNEKDLPAAVLQEAEDMGALGGINAAFHGGEVWVVASALNNRNDLERVLAHEIFAHYGLQEILGDRLNPALDQVWSTMSQAEIDALVPRYFAQGQFDPGNRDHRRRVAGERLAQMAENGERPGVLQKLTALIRNWLRRMGFRLQLSRADVMDLLAQARRVVRHGGFDLHPAIYPQLKAEPEYQFADAQFSTKGSEPVQQRQRKFFDGFLGQPIDRLFRGLFELTGSLDEAGRWRSGRKLSKGAQYALTEWMPAEDGVFRWARGPLMAARAGLMDRHGLPSDFRQRSMQMESEERSIVTRGLDFVNRMAKEGVVGHQEAVALHKMIVEGEQIGREEWGRLGQEIREAVDEMGRELVEMGMISPESYQRNLGTYLHRVYLKHESRYQGLTRWAKQVSQKRRKKIQGNALKGRGLDWKESQSRLLRDVPEGWWGRRREAGQADKALKGQTFRLLERYTGDDRSGQFEGLEEGGRKRRLMRRVWWPSDQAVPAEFSAENGFQDRGEWEVRTVDGGQVTLWRDFTKAEREKMGEILDARYTVLRTFQELAHDLSSGRFFADIAKNPEWTTTQEPDADNWVPAEKARRLATFTDVDWVRVPMTPIKATSSGKGPVYQWGDLAGKYVRSEIWRDLNEMDKMHQKSTWREILTQWKLNKTARSPVVHMNNVMSNLFLMDLIDVSTVDLAKALRSYAKGDENYRLAFEYGAYGNTFVNAEIRRNVLEPLLEEVEQQAREAAQSVTGKTKWLSSMSMGLWRGLKRMDRRMIELYQVEDEIFRLATFTRRLEQGDPPEVAAQVARDQFLNYDIRAPWINAVRGSVLPFISYTYRAVPAVAQAIAERPWKLAKYYTLAKALEIMAYELAPGDEEKERASMREEIQGYTWIGVPRMIRWPMRDQHDNPMFQDILRWIPAGDVFDLNQGQLGVPAWMQVGGPLMLGAELFLNKQAFTGQEIWDPLADDYWERMRARGGWFWRAWMPSAVWIPGGWHNQKLVDAARGGKDWLGRPYSTPAALASGFGIKVQPQDVDVNFELRMREVGQRVNAVRWQMRELERDRSRNLVSDSWYQARRQKLQSKMERLERRVRELQEIQAD